MSRKAHSRDLSVFGWRCLAGQVKVSPRLLQTGLPINPTGSDNNCRIFSPNVIQIVNHPGGGPPLHPL